MCSSDLDSGQEDAGFVSCGLMSSRQFASIWNAPIFAALALLLAGSTLRAADWWPASTAAALSKAGTNSAEITAALNRASEAQREGIQFLVENMPERDLQSLSAAFLLENLGAAYEAWEKAPWRSSISKEMFFNDILPYACVNEQRDSWRKKLRDLSLPLIAGCKTPEIGRAHV